jgi:phenylalanyl-tRNA synthetase alpha chain
MIKKEIMSNERREASLSVPDLTDPRNGVHAINIIVEKIQKVLEKTYPETNVKELRSNPVVTVEENFDALLFPYDNPGRSSRYTRYVTEDKVLRTHTSAAIPQWLKQVAQKGTQDILVTLPGICYRRDIVDRTHCPEPHQLDVWRIKRSQPQFNRSDLIHLIETILNAVVPGYEYRANEVTHPYTINGLEVEILVNNEWLEVLECGEANPTVLENAGLDTREYSGLALGMGLDRLAMIIKSIDDIRILRSKDPRIARQMTNLEKYKPVSNQPPTKRVLSYSTSKDKSEEDVCEEIKDELGHEAHYLEEVEYSEVPYEDLPEKAKENLGIHPHQKNAIVKLIFRSPEGTLEREMVNKWMQRLYPRLNEGDKGYM